MITCSSAHGASTSQSSSISSSFVIASPPFSSASEPPARLCANAAATSSPFGVVEAARRVGDRDDGRAELGDELREERADVAEALDRDAQPCERATLLRASADSRQKTAPRAVASARPSEPPIVSGLPVTTPSTEWPLFIEYVSKIQAIIAALVPTSGAGMSFSGPISLMISDV